MSNKAVIQQLIDRIGSGARVPEGAGSQAFKDGWFHATNKATEILRRTVGEDAPDYGPIHLPKGGRVMLTGIIVPVPGSGLAGNSLDARCTYEVRSDNGLTIEFPNVPDPAPPNLRFVDAKCCATCRHARRSGPYYGTVTCSQYDLEVGPREICDEFLGFPAT